MALRRIAQQINHLADDLVQIDQLPLRRLAAVKGAVAVDDMYRAVRFVDDVGGAVASVVISRKRGLL